MVAAPLIHENALAPPATMPNTGPSNLKPRKDVSRLEIRKLAPGTFWLTQRIPFAIVAIACANSVSAEKSISANRSANAAAAWIIAGPRPPWPANAPTRRPSAGSNSSLIWAIRGATFELPATPRKAREMMPRNRAISCRVGRLSWKYLLIRA
jgi:hypothetical protein